MAKIELSLSEDFTPSPRDTCPALDELLGAEFKVHEHGFVRVVDYMGNTTSIVEAARVSYGKRPTPHTWIRPDDVSGLLACDVCGIETPSGPLAGIGDEPIPAWTLARAHRQQPHCVPSDVGLIRYLMRHSHTSPLEMCELKLHVKLPIAVARQWIRHRTANVNEISARYSILDREFYFPAPADIEVQSKSNKQGRGGVLTALEADAVLTILHNDAEQTYANYRHLANTGTDGKPEDPTRPQVARELARLNLTLNTYTQWYWKIDLHNLLHFLSRRAHPHAQKEIRDYADLILAITRAWVPDVVQAFDDYHPFRNAHTFSGPEMDALRVFIQTLGSKACDGALELPQAWRRAFAQKHQLGTKRECGVFWRALGLLPDDPC